MNYLKPKAKDPFLGDLPIENIFISEYMPDAPGDFVKVYLYGRFFADLEKPIDPKEMAAHLGISEAVISEAWDYWERVEAVKKRYFDGEGRLDFTVEFLNLKEHLYGVLGDEGIDSGVFVDGEKEGEKKDSFGNETLKTLMMDIEKTLGRPLGVNEMQNVISWAEDLKASPEVIRLAVDYSAGKGKSNFRYISAVIEGWTEQGLTTLEKVKTYIEEFDQKFVRYRRVMQALGLSRNATEEERRIMDTWFEELGFSMDKVLEACGTTAGISNPNIKYVNTVLQNWAKDISKGIRDASGNKRVSNTVLKEYYEYLRDKADREAEERKQEIYRVLPEIKKMDEDIRDIGVRLARSFFSGSDVDGERLTKELERLNEDRLICLAENDYDVNYTDPRYKCTKCNDTGIAEMGGPCTCREQRRDEAELWQKQREEKR